jgi:hypothetical protein
MARLVAPPADPRSVLERTLFRSTVTLSGESCQWIERNCLTELGHRCA